MSNHVVWFQIYVSDMERARKFYESVFQTSLTRLENPASTEGGPETWAFPADRSQYGASGTLTKLEGVGPGGNGTIVYFGCEDCAVESGRVEEFGGKLMREKFSIGDYGWIAIASDTEGNVIGFHSPK